MSEEMLKNIRELFRVRIVSCADLAFGRSPPASLTLGPGGPGRTSRETTVTKIAPKEVARAYQDLLS
ncbi:hypothetical protein VSH64_34060 [Amycolatopsis rhabdoformis]|uniref:Uncharacterized protein n=1 Tax=Amycolatopsis rhabdoformis TaxID=1448059 RepID=A0ABZ1I0W3_9PSEU|nr:hypothetical protein [Amycolatopsis rhabdoformis]WSE27845.1 hypothetical protein VSH64_34060 [Amycolatopsis rhabdoformis]